MRFWFALVLGFFLVSLPLVGIILGVASGSQHEADAASPERLEGLVAPVQTVVDAFEVLVREAQWEAEHDGEPHRARAILGDMEGFVQDFTHIHAWPEPSVAHSIDYPVALRFAQDVVLLAGLVPETFARTEVTYASCQAQYERATAAQASTWLQLVREAQRDHQVLLVGLEQTVDDLPVDVDVRPLLRGIERLETWGGSRLESTLGCVIEVAAREQVLVPDDNFGLFVHPGTSWPTGTVHVFGAVGRDITGDEVHLHAPGLELDRHLSIGETRAFFVPHQIPLHAELGPHTVTGSIGDEQASRELIVEKAPVTLIVDAPGHVQAQGTFDVRVRMVDPLQGHVAPGEVVLTGDLEGAQEPEEGRARWSFDAPLTGGWLTGTVRVDEDAYRQAAQADYAVFVVDPTAQDDPSTPAAPAAPTGPGGGLEGTLDQIRDGFDGVAWLLLMLALVVFVVLGLLVARRASIAPRPGRSQSVLEEVLRIPRRAVTSLVVVMAGLHTWCVHVGLVPRSATVRDVARRFGAPPVLRRGVLEFERVRYGGQPEDAERSAALSQEIRRGWRRLLRRPPGGGPS
jgi:hypothetical protein